MRIIIKSTVFSVLLSMFINNTLAQVNLFNFEEIEIGAKKISKFYDSITYVKQKNFTQVYYIDFSIYKNCEKSYRIIACHDLMSLLSKRYNYYFSIYKRYYIFYCNDSIEHYRIKFVDEAFRNRLTQFFIHDNTNYFSGDVGMGCEFNSCSENKLYLAYPPGSRYINRKKLEE